MTKTALYRLFDATGQLLYVGITDHLGARWEGHMREKPWWPSVQRQTIDWLAGREEAALAEITAIREESPIFNIQHSTRPVPISPAAAEAEAKAELANARYEQLKAEAEAAQADLFDACAAAVQAGSTPERLADRVSFTAAYIRRKLRERGVERLRTGPKPRE